MFRRKTAGLALAVAAGVAVVSALTSSSAALATQPRDRALSSAESSPAEVAARADAVRFRGIFNLRRDDGYLDNIRDQYARGQLRGASQDFGVLLTGEEAAEMRRRQELAERSSRQVRDYFARGRSDQLSGIFIDADGKLNVLVTAGEQEHRDALQRIVYLPERLVVSSARHSLEALTTAQALLSSRLSNYAAEGVDIRSIALDEAGNRLIVKVSSDADAAQQRLSKDVDPSLLAVTAGAGASWTGTPYLNSPPFRAGQRIIRSGVSNSDCTSAFGAYRSTSPTTYYVMAAGHCAQANTCWSQGLQGNATYIGCVEATTYVVNTTRRSDAARIKINTATYRSNDIVTACCPEGYRNILAEEDPTKDMQGQPVCQYGYVTISSCGSLLSRNVTVNPEPGHTLIEQRQANYSCTYGDSGSGVTNGGGLAIGIQSTRESNGLCYYSHIFNARRETGVAGLLFS